MPNKATPKYQRILLKLSGEALGQDGIGIDPKVLDRMALEIGDHIGAQRADIGDPARIDRVAIAGQFMPVPFGNLLLLARQIV